MDKVFGTTIDELTELATAMLTSMDKTVRDEAANRLRFLSSFDSWHTVKRILPMCTSNYLRFVVCKAINFMVYNELDARERREVQISILAYFKSMHESGEILPPYIRNELFSIYATATFLDWRMKVISVVQNSTAVLGQGIIDELSAVLPMSDVLDCAVEVVTRFASEDRKNPLFSTCKSFMMDILPFFFRLGVEQLQSHGRKALQLCCVALENVLPLSAWNSLPHRRETVRDEISSLPRDSIWPAAIQFAVSTCADALLADPTMTDSDLCVRFLRMASAVQFTGSNRYEDCETNMSYKFLDLSGKLLQLYQQTHLTCILHLACAILINAFMCHEDAATSFLYSNMELVSLWGAAVREIVGRWSEEEEDLRNELMYLFCVIANLALSCRNISASQSKEMSDHVIAVVHFYFNAVMDRSHLADNTANVDTVPSYLLHIRDLLNPLASIVCCGNVNFYATILEQLQLTIEQYEVCARARKTGMCAAVSDIMLALAVDVGSIFPTLGAADVPLVLMHVCLSRLSVLISIVALSIHNESALNWDELVNVVARFASELLTTDDSLTTALLECLTIFEEDTTNENGGHARHNGDADFGTPLHRGTSSGEVKVHTGVLRSIFFFCICVYDPDAENNRKIYEIITNFVRYVFLHQSDNFLLVMDADNMLRKMLCGGVPSSFVCSGSMMSVLEAVCDGRIPLLRLGSSEMSEKECSDRSMVVNTFSRFLQLQYCPGYTSLNLLSCLLAQNLDRERLLEDPMLRLSDLHGIVSAITKAELMYFVMDQIMTCKETLLELQESLTACAAALLHVCASLSDLCCKILQQNNLCEMHYEFASFSIHALHRFFSTISISQPPSLESSESVPYGEPEGRVFHFPQDAVDDVKLFDVAEIIYGLFRGTWCNIGVLYYYEGSILIRVMLGALSLFLNTSLTLVMSRQNITRRIFSTITVAFSTTGTLGETLRRGFVLHELWVPLLRYLTKCIAYAYDPTIIQAIEMLLLTLNDYGDVLPDFVDSDAIGDVFRELVVMIIVTTSADDLDFEAHFRIIKMCFEHCPEVCAARLGALLQFCSAYHRVRLRVIDNILRSGQGDLSGSYTAVFGAGSRVPTLSAW